MASKAYVRWVALPMVLALVALSTTGCGYLKNLRDDVLDVGTLAVGFVPAVVPGPDGPQAIGFLPPAFGVYAQATELLHLGFIYKATGDLEWDRRGYGVVVDRRTKFGVGPFHYEVIRQTPIAVNDYKTTGNELDGWRRHMDGLTDPITKSPAKTLIYEPVEGVYTGRGEDPVHLPYLARGWQDWEMFSLEVAVPEPFILHSGFYARVGFDPSQIFDLALSVFCIDFYGDAAYTFSGEPKH